MSYFSKFCFKLEKADADILRKYIQTDLKNGLVTANLCSLHNQETPEVYLEPSRASMIEIFCKNS